LCVCLDAERHKERAGDWSDVRDAVCRHGPQTAPARGPDRDRVQETHVGTHEPEELRQWMMRIEEQNMETASKREGKEYLVYSVGTHEGTCSGTVGRDLRTQTLARLQ